MTTDTDFEGWARGTTVMNLEREKKDLQVEVERIREDQKQLTVQYRVLTLDRAGQLKRVEKLEAENAALRAYNTALSLDIAARRGSVARAGFESKCRLPAEGAGMIDQEFRRYLLDIIEDGAEPDFDANFVPVCSQERCSKYDGKRCELVGHRPDRICEPAIIDVLNALRESAP